MEGRILFLSNLLVQIFSILKCCRCKSFPGTAPAGSFNMDTPWLYVFMAHKLSLPQSHTLQLSAELSARKWLRVNGLALEALYKDCGREREARLHLYTPTLAYVKVRSKG